MLDRILTNEMVVSIFKTMWLPPSIRVQVVPTVSPCGLESLASQPLVLLLCDYQINSGGAHWTAFANWVPANLSAKTAKHPQTQTFFSGNHS
ncbi:hypothetical protein L2E82_01798 [Cichorium intybus]|uniref:Uncharacterized protein n=1 Tax=Cichorium intybus TaxID=13427 RepID=A0ACB9GZV7_CICIN|nr:hypothetical protein L2E82_01798 [Cichorium intybus]